MLTAVEAAQRMGRNTSTIRRIRSGLLEAEMASGRWRTASDALDEVRDGIYLMLEMPVEWRRADGTSAPNGVAAVALSRIGH